MAVYTGRELQGMALDRKITLAGFATVAVIHNYQENTLDQEVAI